MDEVEFSDPAANLYLGHGFTSTMWAQDPHAFWCGNVPLYPSILYGFFKFFGFGLLQARVFNALLTAAAGLSIWCALRRSNFLESAACRLLALLLVLSGSVSTMTFRMARYDAAIFFLCALIFFACTLPARRGIRHVTLLLLSALLPFTGLAMLPYVGLLCILYAGVYGSRQITIPASVAGGLVLGVAGMFLFYNHIGMWQEFEHNVLHFTAVGHFAHQESHSLRNIILGASPTDENLLNCFFGNPTEYLNKKTLFDHSAFLLFLVVILLSFGIWTRAERHERRLIVFIVLVTLVTPPVMFLAGHYFSYYRWMTYEPLCIVVPRFLEIARGPRLVARWMRRAAFSMIGLSLLLGVPFRTLTAVPNWRGRSIQPIELAAARMVRPSDIVVCSHKAYYAIKPRAAVVYGFGLPGLGDFGSIKDFHPQDVTLLCVLPEDREKIFNAVGGEWERVQLEGPLATTLAHTVYAMEFYRRPGRLRQAQLAPQDHP